MKKFLPIDWMVGFIDGDGYFGLEKMKRKRQGKTEIFYRPILAISQNNIQILYKIKSRIGCGTVSPKGKKKDQFHYRIRSAEHMKNFFFSLIPGNRFQTNKKLQYELLKKAVFFLTTQYNPQNKNHNLFLEQIDNDLRIAKNCCFLNSYLISSDWLIGFLEAEGTFYFDMASTQPTRFLIKITQKNKPLLEKIQKTLGYGKVHKERNTIYYFGCYNRVDLQKIFRFLEKNPFYSHKNIVRIQWLKAYRQFSKQPSFQNQIKM